ncbi:Centromere protein S [Echinococcus granulosus]|uniref:Centromere protein S n=1 Tax=Echinococcus granulosus TaxID=6210 RepID=W6U7X6_ECHGR|nr:Centromere protein S [Echinococcus granulosus]EUB57333.1 Centromere protein S [Echinococcus granulosus]
MKCKIDTPRLKNPLFFNYRFRLRHPEHLSALHYECIARAKVVSDRSGVHIPDEIASLVTETAFRFAQMLTTDLESFAHHAKRSTINQDDVLLFARRNPQLRKFLNEKLATFDDAADADDNMELQLVKRSARQKVKNAKKSLEKSFTVSPLKTYFARAETVATTSAVTSPSVTSVKNSPVRLERVPSTPNVKRKVVSPLKRALLETALAPSQKTPSSSRTAEAMVISPQKTSERVDSPLPTVSTPVKDDRQQPGAGPLRVSLLDSDDDFSTIFDDVGDV